MSKFVKGKVLECTLNKGFTYIKVQREVGEGYFVVRAKGDTSFEIGKSETFRGVTLNEKLTNEERKVYDLDSGIKEGNTTWTPTEQSTQSGLDQPTKPEVVYLDPSVTAIITSQSYEMASRATNPNLDEQAEIYFWTIMKATAQNQRKIEKAVE